MSDETPAEPTLETDERFPSGPWTGFYLQAQIKGRQWMELDLTFATGVVRGTGRDRIGEFLFRGRYDVADGRCWWTKRYFGKHDVAYQGYNEGRGIWGKWEISREWHGGFHIWPVTMGDPSGGRLAEEAELPELVEVGAG